MDAIRTANALLEECKSLVANAEAARRELSPSEHTDVKAKLDTVERAPRLDGSIPSPLRERNPG
jgi:hypothetical protein